MSANCTTAPNLTADYLKGMISAFEMFPKPVVVGVAVSPKVKTLIDREAKPAPQNIFASLAGFDIIVDPRLGDTSEVFYDRAAWQARCAEQRSFDQKAA